MAQVAPQTQSEAWVDRSLDYLEQAWEAVPKVAAAWDDWDEEDRLDFVLEWPLREDRLIHLGHLSDEGRLSAPQRQRHAAIQVLVQRHRSMLARLLAD
jgi:hypothetical protein